MVRTKNLVMPTVIHVVLNWPDRTIAAGPARMDSSLSHVNPNAVQRPQVVKGRYALTWGPGTVAAIQVHTRRPDFADETEGGGRTVTRYSDNGQRSDVFGEAWAAEPRRWG